MAADISTAGPPAVAGTSLTDGVIFHVLGGPIYELPLTAAVTRRFLSAYGFDPNRYGIDVYHEIHLCAEAMRLAGRPDDHSGVGACLGRANSAIAGGTLCFDPRTHLARCGDDAVPMRWFQFRGAQPRHGLLPRRRVLRRHAGPQLRRVLRRHGRLERPYGLVIPARIPMDR
jgi:hypothetical protein